MSEQQFPHLFSPIILANTYFRNRIFASPQGSSFCTYGNQLTEEDMAFYERKALGGCASVCIGDSIVDSELGCGNGPHIHMDDPFNAVALNRATRRINRHGAVSSIELNHCGSSSRVSFLEGHTIYGPIAKVTRNQHSTEDIIAQEMPEEIIERTIQKFADAAYMAKMCGFGMVTVHGGHGWLLSQFMFPTNDRKDMWGGSFENRMRFPIAVAEAIKKKCGKDFVVEMRISGSEVYDGGYDLDYGIQIAKALDGHVDLIHVSAGCHEVDEVFTVTHPNLFLEDGVNVKYAAEIKKHVKTPVACVGSLSDPEMMEEIIASGKADVIQLARQLSADPDTAYKASHGHPEEVRQCLRCLQCFSSLIQGQEYSCAVNPQIGRSTEYVYGINRKVTAPAKVLIAGGGIAGMQAALTAADRGHKVILCEKTDRLGGVLRCEANVPFKKHLDDYLNYQERHVLNNPSIEVMLNREVTPEFAESVGADAIIAAIGATEFVPPIQGIRGENVISAQELYVHPEKAGENIVILGGGLVGTELSVYLSMLGHKCRVLEMADVLTYGGNQLHGMALQLQFKKYDIEVLTGTRAVEITPAGVKAEKDGKQVFYEADTVVTAMGMRPNMTEAIALKNIAQDFYLAGDCKKVRSVREANWDGYQSAMDINIF